jgi:glycerophosphoryl diester phosphodiesterase
MAAPTDWLTSRPIAHRGLHDEARPENSLAAFRAAMAAGYPIELDVQLLGDGTPVVFHDADLARVCGVSRGLASERAETLGGYRLLGTDERIPTLREVLDTVAGAVPLLVELKVRPGASARVAEASWEVLRSYRGPFAVQSFDPYALRWYRKNAPDVPRGQLAGALLGDELAGLTRFASRTLLVGAISRPHFLHYELSALPSGWVSSARWLFRLPLVCWTVRSEAERERAVGLGAGYVFDGLRP